MVLNTNATLQAIASHLSASGAAQPAGEDGFIGDPKSPPNAQPDGRYPVSVRNSSARVEELALNGSSKEQHVVIITAYGAFLDADGTVETKLYDAMNRIMAKLTADADLGGNIRHIDVAGILGVKMGAEWGYKEIGGTEFRVIELTLPLYIDDNQTVTA
jgi:hypothetical protein